MKTRTHKPRTYKTERGAALYANKLTLRFPDRNFEVRITSDFKYCVRTPNGRGGWAYCV